jgi:hypothetical protein
MSTLLEKALERVVALPQNEQDEDAWKKRFAEKREIIRRLASEALDEDARGETLPLTAPIVERANMVANSRRQTIG